MFKDLRKKFAKVAFTALVFQLAFFGLGTGATAAKADANTSTKSVTLSSDILSKTFVAGQAEDVSLSIDNIGGLDYSGVNAELTLVGADSKTLKSLDYIDGATKTDLLPAFTETSTGFVADYSLGDFTGTYSKTFNFNIVFSVPGTYGLDVVLTDSFGDPVASLLLDAAHNASFDVAGSVLLTTDLPATVKKGTDVAFTAALDNTYGFTRGAVAKLTVKDSLVADIAKLQITSPVSADAVLTQAGTDVIAEAALPVILNGNVYTYGFNVNLATEKTYNYSIEVVDVADPTILVAKYVGKVTADGTGPIVTMTSKPVIVNDIKKATEVTFSANEALKLSSPNVSFKQNAVTYNGTPNAQVDLTNLTVVIPADTFAAGTTPIDVAATFVDDLGNATAFSGQIKVNTVAPNGVTGLTTFVNSDGTVTLSWEKPLGDYSGFRVLRDGIEIFEITNPNQTTYTDNNTVRGETYVYSVVVYNEAGLENTSPGTVSITIPKLVVAAVLSDSADYTTQDTTDTSAEDTTDETDTTDATDVKANLDEGTDDSGNTADSKSDFPIWGVILLIIIAAVGGYLIWNQKPAAQPVITVETKKKKSENKTIENKVATSSPKKTNTKKK